MSDDRIAEYRKKLLATLAGLDQLATSYLPLINDLHKLLNGMRAEAEGKIDALR